MWTPERPEGLGVGLEEWAEELRARRGSAHRPRAGGGSFAPRRRQGTGVLRMPPGNRRPEPRTRAGSPSPDALPSLGTSGVLTQCHCGLPSCRCAWRSCGCGASACCCGETSRLGPLETAILMELDEEVSRGPVPDATLTWLKHTVFHRANPARVLPNTADVPAGGGVYIVYQNKDPIYVGETANFATRWRGRLTDLHQLGLMTRELTPPLQIEVKFGILTPNTRPVRKVVEHSLIQALIKGHVVSEHQLRNEKLRDEFKVKGRILIRNIFPPDLIPKAIRFREWDPKENVLTLDPQTTSTFELYPELPFP